MAGVGGGFQPEGGVLDVEMAGQAGLQGLLQQLRRGWPSWEHESSNHDVRGQRGQARK